MIRFASLLFLVAITSSGCSIVDFSPNETGIDVNADNAFTYGARIVFEERTRGRTEEQAEFEASEEAEGTGQPKNWLSFLDALGGIAATEFEFVRSRSDLGQTVSSPGRISVGGTEYALSQRLDLDVELEQWSVGGRGGPVFFDFLALEGILGLSYIDLSIRAEGIEGDDRDRVDTFGPYAGGRASIFLNDDLRIYAETRTHLGYFSGKEEVSLDDSQVGVLWVPIENIGIAAGWRWREYEVERDSFNLLLSGFRELDEYEIDLSGPMVSLEIRF